METIPIRWVVMGKDEHKIPSVVPQMCCYYYNRIKVYLKYQCIDSDYILMVEIVLLSIVEKLELQNSQKYS